ncbi:MAG: DUF4160 domain-containing protein [Methylococcaceae bacterium]|nr:MAG: DUF4160 domain-containing protein [Methylococcaceae bacterium]
MPIISMFYGVIIYMYAMDDRQHHCPHIHVEYAEFEAALEIPSGALLAGKLPPRQMKLVQAWIEIHADELMADWKVAMHGGEIFRIDPLR